jgi:hypothetical protein
MARSTNFNSSFMAEDETTQTNDFSRIPLIFLTKFSASVDEYVQGRLEASSLIHNNLEAWKTFRIAIRRTAPNFQPFTNAMGSLSGGFRDWSEEDEDMEAVINSDQKPFHLTDMRKHLQQCVCFILESVVISDLLIVSFFMRELLNNIPFAAKSQLIISFQQNWLRIAETCFDRVHEAMSDVIDKTILNHFQRFGILQSHLRCVIFPLCSIIAFINIAFVSLL